MMGGGLTARVGTLQTSTLVVRMDDGVIHVRSNDVLRPALELWKLRRALAGIGVRTPPGGPRVRVKLGRLPAFGVH